MPKRHIDQRRRRSKADDPGQSAVGAPCLRGQEGQGPMPLWPPMVADAAGCEIGEKEVQRLDPCKTRIRARAGLQVGTSSWPSVSERGRGEGALRRLLLSPPSWHEGSE